MQPRSAAATPIATFLRSWTWVSTRPGATLIAWHHEAQDPPAPKIPQHLGGGPTSPDYRWPPDRFDVIWTLPRDGDGWRFAQVPQLLLPGDLPYSSVPA